MLAECILLFLYYWYGLSYSKGCAKYVKTNYGKLNKTFLILLKNEIKEFIHAAKHLLPLILFLKFFDIMHIIVNIIFVNILPRFLYCNRLYWLLFFPFFLPTSIKLAHRYNTYGCVRLHPANTIDHSCIINMYAG